MTRISETASPITGLCVLFAVGRRSADETERDVPFVI